MKALLGHYAQRFHILITCNDPTGKAPFPMKASTRSLMQFCSACFLIAIIAWVSLRMNRMEVAALPPVPQTPPTAVEWSLKNAETMVKLKEFAQHNAEARQRLNSIQATLQDPLLSLPDVGDSELRRVKTVPWGGTDPDSFWRSQMNSANQTLREAGLGRYSR